ncbi:MAG: hypothetical protein IJP74_06005 [Prevotella sp.]|nr:hypothetical protein [Prevotella sp.]
MKKRLFSTLLMGAFFIASMSMFTSCKDYDDDINALQTDVDAIKATLNKQVAELQSAKSNYDTQIEQIKASLALKLDKADAKFATAADIENAIAEIEKKLAAFATASALEDLIKDGQTLAGKVEANEAAIKDLQAFQNQIEAINPQLSILTQTIDGLTSTVNDPEKGLLAVNTQLANQLLLIQALQDAVKKIQDNPGTGSTIDLSEYVKKADLAGYASTAALADYLKKSDLPADINNFAKKIADNETAITTLNNKVADYETVKTAISNLQTSLGKLSGVDVKISNLESAMNGIQTTIINTIKEHASVLTVYVSSALSGLQLMPKFYVNGIEAIGVPMLVYQPVWAVKDAIRPETYICKVDGKERAVPLRDEVDIDATYTRGYGGEEWYRVRKPVVTTEDIHWPEGTNLLITAITGGLDYNTLGYKMYQNFPNFHAYYLTNPKNADLKDSNVSLYVNYPEVTENYTQTVWETAELAATARGNATRATATPTSDQLQLKVVDTKVTDSIAKYAKAKGYYDLEMSVNTQQFVNQYVKSFVDMWDSKRGVGIWEVTRQLPFVAAAVTKTVDGESRTVSSDWAALTPWLLHIVALADNAPQQEIKSYSIDKLSTEAEDYGWAYSYEQRAWSVNDNDHVTSNHLYPTAESAIHGEYTHEVKYDGTIDLSQFVETHFGYVATAFQRDKKMPQELMDAMGLYYEYALVDYISDDYTTSESLHATLDSKTGILTPRDVEVIANGRAKTITDKKATRASVDREPLVRVMLKASKTGVHGAPQSKLEDDEVLMVGYIKVRIVTELAAYYGDITIDIPNTVYMNCPGWGYVTWAQIENEILKRVTPDELFDGKGISEYEFRNEYELEMNRTSVPSETGGAVRYIELDGRYLTEADYIKYLENKYKTDDNFLIEDLVKKNIDFAKAYYKAFAGYINYTGDPTNFLPDDAKAKETEIIYWVFGADHSAHAHSYLNGSTIPSYVDQAYVTYLAKPDFNTGKNTQAIETIIRFNHKAKSNKSIFVKLRIPVGSMQFATAELGNKVHGEWFPLYKDGDPGSDANAKEVRINVTEPRYGDGTADGYAQLHDRDFGKNLTHFFNNHIVKWTNIDEHFLTTATVDAEYPTIPIYQRSRWENAAFTTAADGSRQDQISFWLTSPNTSKGNILNSDNNAQEVTRLVDGVSQPAMVWTVKGYSGATYELAIANYDPISGAYYTSALIDTVDTREIYEYKNLDTKLVALDRGHYIINIAADGTATPIVSLLDTKVNDWMNPWLDVDYGQTDHWTNFPNETQNEYIRFQQNQIAEDILNYKGRKNDVNSAHTARVATRELGEMEAFRAYIEVVYAGACYELYDNNSRYFNTIFERPVNFYPFQIVWEVAPDAVNTGTYFDFMDFLEQEKKDNHHFKTKQNTFFAFFDWRNYDLIRDNDATQSDKRGFYGGAATPQGMYDYSHTNKGNGTNVPATVLWSFYDVMLDNGHDGTIQWVSGDIQNGFGWTNTLVKAIRTDIGDPMSDADAYNLTLTAAGRETIAKLPLAASRVDGRIGADDFKVNQGLDLTVSTAYSNGNTGPVARTFLHYQNTQNNVHDFHLFVPIYWSYVLGSSDFMFKNNDWTISGITNRALGLARYTNNPATTTTAEKYDYFRTGLAIDATNGVVQDEVPAMTYGVITIKFTKDNPAAAVRK